MKILLGISFTFISCIGIAQEVETVYSDLTGKTWMAKNLGAESIATSITDDSSFGDLYQWGRSKDGHQLRNSAITTLLSNSTNPNHSFFILGSSNWMVNQIDDLWQVSNGINNPCPQGFRLPTEQEFEAERNTWTSNNAEGAFNSPLKLSIGGARSRMSGQIGNVGTFVGYRTSTINGDKVRLLGVSLSDSFMGSRDRSDGNCIRCIKDEPLSLDESTQSSKKLIKIIDILGRESDKKSNKILFYIYDDGSAMKRIIAD